MTGYSVAKQQLSWHFIVCFSFIYLCANYFRVHDAANSDDANRLHCDDDGGGRLLRPLLLPMINPFGPCMRHFRFLIVIQALHVSYFPIVRPEMLDCCEAVAVVVALLTLLPLPPQRPLLQLPVAIAIAAAVDPIFGAVVAAVATALRVAIAPNAQLSNVDCDENVNDGDDDDDDEAPEIQEISFVDSNATTVADSNAECLSVLFCLWNVCVCVKSR